MSAKSTKKASKRVKKNPGQKSKGGDWHKKIAANRGESWKENFMQGRRDAVLNPSLIRLQRVKKSLDQSDIAKSLGVSESTFGAIERGKRLVKQDVALKISSKLGVSVSKLFKSTGKKYVAIIHRASL